MSDAKLITVREPKIPSATEYEDVSYTFAELRETWPKGDESVVGKLLDLVELQSAREKYWHDHILAASGGHATTPEGAREFINSLRDMLDVAKGETNATKAQLLKFAELIRDADHVSRERFEYYGLCDQLDNNGKPYPSQFCADMVVQAAGILKAAALATGSEAGK